MNATVTPIDTHKLCLAERLALADLIDMSKELALRGEERGTNQQTDLLTQTADGADLNAMWREYQRLIRLHNAERDPLVSLLSYRVRTLVEKVMYPVEEDFEEATEFGEPKGIRHGKPFILGFGFKWWDIAIRYTWLWLAESTRADVDALTNEALESDNRLMFTRILRQLFNPITEVATIENVPVNVYPLYNNDGTVPPKYKTTVHAGTHTHYLVSGGAAIDPVDLQDAETHLSHHGYTLARNYKMMLLVNETEGQVIRTFKNGVNGAKYDFIPSAGYGGGVFLPANSGIVARPGGDIPGMIIIGTYGPFLIGVEDYMPPGYVLAFVTGGEDNIGNLIGIREHAQANLRGLRLVKGRDADYPLVDSFYQHGMGTGIRHRGAAVVMQIKASGTYDIPAAYV